MEKLKSRFKVQILVFFAFFLILTTHHSQLTAVVHAYTHDTSLIKWYEYSPQAFEKAKKEDKPIFMLITAIWCYWCHVYEEKTLETKEVAEYINTNFIPIFVDYDRRKDIAAKWYPTAGGLPTTVIFTPSGEEIVAVPGYMEKAELINTLKTIVAYIKKEYKVAEKLQAAGSERGIVILTADDLQRVLLNFENNIQVSYDPIFGGIGMAEKMPYAEVFDYLLELYERTKDKRWFEMVTNTIEHMAGLRQKLPRGKRPDFETLQNLYREKDRPDWVERIAKLQFDHRIVGIFDRVEGGFFRYATQRDWTIPHYEKLVDSNAEQVKLYLHAYRITGDEGYKGIAVRTLDYVEKSLYDAKDGRFYGSQDADEIYYHLTLGERKKVGSPRVDKTSYTSTNANAIIAFLYAGDVLKDKKYTEVATKALSFFASKMVTPDGVLTYYDSEKGKGLLNGQLEGNAWILVAFLEGYGYTKDKRWLEVAEDLLRYSLERLYDEKNGGFFERRSTSREFYREEELFLKNKPYNHNGIMAYALIRAYEFTKKEDYLKRARETIGAFQGVDPVSPYSPYFQRVAGYLLKTP